MRWRASIVVALATAACLVGCATTSAPGDVEPSPPVAEPSPSPADPCPVAAPVEWGHVVASRPVVDALGEYCAVSPAEESPAMQFDESAVDLGSLDSWEFTREDAVLAQRTAVTFLVEEVLDSAVLDTEANGGFDAWLAATGYRFPEYAPTEGLLLQGRLPPLARDGGPRASSIEVEVVGVEAQGGKAGPRSIMVRLEALASFRPASGGEPIVATTEYLLTLDADGGIVGYGYDYALAGE